MWRLVVRWYNPFLRRAQENVLDPLTDSIHTDGHIILSRLKGGFVAVVDSPDIISIFPHKF